jgi:alpha-acetolactate decarboxylase
MIDFSKPEKRELRRLAGEAYKAEMEKELAKLEADFKTRYAA